MEVVVKGNNISKKKPNKNNLKTRNTCLHKALFFYTVQPAIQNAASNQVKLKPIDTHLVKETHGRQKEPGQL
jgi:hypothetical protein